MAQRIGSSRLGEVDGARADWPRRPPVPSRCPTLFVMPLRDRRRIPVTRSLVRDRVRSLGTIPRGWYGRSTCCLLSRTGLIREAPSRDPDRSQTLLSTCRKNASVRLQLASEWEITRSHAAGFIESVYFTPASFELFVRDAVHSLSQAVVVRPSQATDDLALYRCQFLKTTV